MKHIEVVAAVILQDGKVLCVQRPQNDKAYISLKWEFPGGKVEADESVETALKRELLEEIGIEVQQCEPLVRIEHDYSDKSVVLDVWVVSSFSGKAIGLEGQPIEWINPVDMDAYPFPEANLPIIAALKTRLGL